MPETGKAPWIARDAVRMSRVAIVACKDLGADLLIAAFTESPSRKAGPADAESNRLAITAKRFATRWGNGWGNEWAEAGRTAQAVRPGSRGLASYCVNWS